MCVVRVSGVVCPWVDGVGFRDVVVSGLRVGLVQVHRGRWCGGCVVCEEVVGEVFERVLVVWGRSGECGWRVGRVRAAARSAFGDVVRGRLSEFGLAARPERWLGQKGFLPEEPVVGRVLVVLVVLAVGYFSVFPGSVSRFVLDVGTVGRLVEGVRVGGRSGLSVVRRWWEFDPGVVSVSEVAVWGQRALDVWRVADSARYAGLLALNAANAGAQPVGGGVSGADGCPLWTDGSRSVA